MPYVLLLRLALSVTLVIWGESEMILAIRYIQDFPEYSAKLGLHPMMEMVFWPVFLILILLFVWRAKL